jgi:hypothetical protein
VIERRGSACRGVGIEQRAAAHVWLPWSVRFHNASWIETSLTAAFYSSA